MVVYKTHDLTNLFFSSVLKRLRTLQNVLADKFVKTCVFSLIFLFSAEMLLAEENKVLHPGAGKQGFYVALTTGQLFFGKSDRALFKEGWVTGLKFGYDIWKFLGIETLFKFSGHHSTVGTQTVGVPKSFFVYQAIGQLKGAIPIFRRVFLEIGVGGGLWYTNPNQKTTVGQVNRGMAYGEIGLEYFLRTRGLSIGLDPSLAAVQNLESPVIQATGFLRYTF